MDFTGAQSFLLAAEARAARFPVGRTIDAKRLDGTFVARLEVPAGHWVVVDEDGACSMEDEVFRALYVQVPGDERSFVRRGAPVRAIRGQDGVMIEGRDNPVPSEDFDRLAVRLDSEGSPLCRLSWPMWRQAKILKNCSNRGAGHLDDLKAERARHLAGIISDPDTMADLHMLDGILAASTDRIDDQSARVLAMAPADFGDGSLTDLLAASLGVNPAVVIPVTQMPTYGEAAFRSMGRRHLEPFFGGRQMEDAVCLALPHAFPGSDGLRRAIAAWLEEGELVAEGPRLTPAEMPGYETSEMRHARFPGGLDVLHFEDLFGTYVYGWRSPVLENDKDPDGPMPGRRLN